MAREAVPALTEAYNEATKKEGEPQAVKKLPQREVISTEAKRKLSKR